MTTTPETEAELQTVLDRSAIPNPVLSGDECTVSFTFKVAEAFTPREAVDTAMRALMRAGTDASVFEVEDNDGERYIVRGAHTFDPDAFTAMLPEIRDMLRRADQ